MTVFDGVKKITYICVHTWERKKRSVGVCGLRCMCKVCVLEPALARARKPSPCTTAWMPIWRCSSWGEQRSGGSSKLSLWYCHRIWLIVTRRSIKVRLHTFIFTAPQQRHRSLPGAENVCVLRSAPQYTHPTRSCWRRRKGVVCLKWSLEKLDSWSRNVFSLRLSAFNKARLHCRRCNVV